jgi:hypothetical protein
MAALTSDRNTEYSLGDLLSIPVAAGSRIFAGALVCSNAGGYAVRAADSAGLVFEGVATAQADNRNGEAGDVRVVVRRRGRYRLDCASTLDQSALSAQVYAVDDHTVGVAEDVAHSVAVGVIDKVESAGECWVSIDAGVLAGKAWSAPATTTSRATTTTTHA